MKADERLKAPHRVHLPSTYAGIDKIILAHKGKNPKYDAIVGLSGGKDSTYVAYFLKNEYSLNILRLDYDIGYRSTCAIQNIKRTSCLFGRA